MRFMSVFTVKGELLCIQIDFQPQMPILPHNRAIWQREDIGNYFPDRGRKLILATAVIKYDIIGYRKLLPR